MNSLPSFLYFSFSVSLSFSFPLAYRVLSTSLEVLQTPQHISIRDFTLTMILLAKKNNWADFNRETEVQRVQCLPRASYFKGSSLKVRAHVPNPASSARIHSRMGLGSRVCPQELAEEAPKMGSEVSFQPQGRPVTCCASAWSGSVSWHCPVMSQPNGGGAVSWDAGLSVGKLGHCRLVGCPMLCGLGQVTSSKHPFHLLQKEGVVPTVCSLRLKCDTWAGKLGTVSGHG